MGITTNHTQQIVFAAACSLWAALYSPLAHAQNPPCAVAGDAGNSYENCVSGVCERMVCDGTGYVTQSLWTHSGTESIKFGNDTKACNTKRAGRLRYNPANDKFCFCNGVSWYLFGFDNTPCQYLNAQCWGLNTSGQAPTSVTGPFIDIAAGDLHNCAIKSNGNAQCWGLNTSGQAPTSVTGPFIDIAAGYYHTCAIKSDGNAQCWGNNVNGQAPTSVTGPFINIAAGDLHSCAIKSDGNAQCWGSNGDGQAPTSVTGPFIDIAAGKFHTCAIKSNGNAQCWGRNTDGQAPTSVTGPFIDSAAGQLHTCALKEQ